jgi:hypothetical protein
LYKKNCSGEDSIRVLACAPSNSAADLIAERLLQTVSPSDIFRYYAPSRDSNTVPEGIRKISSFGPGREDLSKDQIAKFK